MCNSVDHFSYECPMHSTKYRKKMERREREVKNDVQDEDVTGNLDYDPNFVPESDKKRLKEVTKKPWEMLPRKKKRFGTGFKRHG